MPPKRIPAPPQSWTVIAIGYGVFALFLAGAGAAYVFFVFDAQFTCERATDRCEMAEEKLFWRDVKNSFQPSQVEKARIIPGRKGTSCVALDMLGGAPEMRFCPRGEGRFVELLNAFIADPTKARLDYRVERGFMDYSFVVIILFFSFIPFWGATSEAMRRLRARP